MLFIAALVSLLPETPEHQKMAAEGSALRRTLRANIAAGDMEKAAREFLDELRAREAGKNFRLKASRSF